MSEHSEHTPHSHTEHATEGSSEQKRNRRKGKALYLGSAAVSAATGAFELSKGLPNGMLGIVANGVHEYGDAAINALRGAAMAARFSTSRRLNKLAASGMILGSAVTLGQTAAEFATHGPEQLISYEPKPVSPHVIGMGGNLAAGGLALAGAKHADVHKAAHTKRHIMLDLKKSAGLLGSSVTGLGGLDAAASLKYGTLESYELGRDMWRHADKPIEELEHTHEHGHTHHHNSVVQRFREHARDVGALVAARMTTLPQAAAERASRMFTRETPNGTRRMRWKPIAALGSLAGVAAGIYMAHRFGVSSSEYHVQSNGTFSGYRPKTSNLFNQLAEMPRPTPQPASPEVPAFVRLQSGSNPWEAIATHTQSLGYPELSVQEHDYLKDIVVDRLQGHNATQLPVGFEVPMPSVQEIEAAFATY